MKAQNALICLESGPIQMPIGELAEWAEKNGLKIAGYQPEGLNAHLKFKDEIVGQPVFMELAGPMYGGEGLVRYENWDLYNRMCD